jgi:hypothetical protein
MRTTVNIEDSLLADVKRMAAERRVSLSAVVEDALRSLLAATTPHAPPPFRLHVVSGALADPDIDLSRTSEILLRDDEASFKPTRSRRRNF